MEIPRELEGRCFTCGFFAKHTVGRANDPGNVPLGYLEVEAAEREKGLVWSHNIVGFGFVNTAPHCFRSVIDFPEITGVRSYDDLVQKVGVDVASKRVVDALWDDRSCVKWWKYTPGFGPQKHMEELRMWELEESRKAHALEMAKLQIAVNESIERVSKDHLDFVKITNRQTAWFNWVLLGLTVAALLLAVGTVLYPNGAEWLDWVPGQIAQSQQSAPSTEASPLQPTS